MNVAQTLIDDVRACGAELRVHKGRLRIRGHERVPERLRASLRTRTAEVVRLLEGDEEPEVPADLESRPGPKGWKEWNGKFPAGWKSAATNPPCVRCGFTTFARDATGAPNHPFACV